jgi:glycosyltransferase involved in cell wall biosynthesis
VTPPTIHFVFYNDPDRYPPIVNSARVLAAHGYRVEIFCRQAEENYAVTYPSLVRVHRWTPGTRRSDSSYAGFLSFLVRRAGRGANVLVGHDMHGLVAAMVLKGLYRTPLVYHCHDFTGPIEARRLGRGGKIIRSLELKLARHADLVVAPDADRAAIMADVLSLPTLPTVVANAPLSEAPVDTGALRQAIERQGHHFDRILFRQGNIGTAHAIEATIRSIPFWTSSRWGFVLMGHQNQAYVAHIRDIATQLGVERQVAILPRVSYDEVSSFTAGADAGCALYEPINFSHTHSATASNKLFEYMAAGLPSIVPDSDAFLRLARAHGCFMTVPHDDPVQIAGAVNRLFGDDAYRETLGRAAHTAFRTVFAYEHQLAPVVNWIDARLERETPAAAAAAG